MIVCMLPALPFALSVALLWERASGVVPCVGVERFGLCNIGQC